MQLSNKQYGNLKRMVDLRAVRNRSLETLLWGFKSLRKVLEKQFFSVEKVELFVCEFVVNNIRRASPFPLF